MTLSTAPRRAAAIAVALLGVLVSVGPASAALLGQAHNTTSQSVSTGSFAVIPTVLTTTPPPGPLVLTYAAALTPPAQYFDAVNTGTIDLVSAGYTVALTALLPLGTNTLTLTACVGGVWNTSAGTCSGTQQSLGSWTSTTASPASNPPAPATAGSRLGIRASLNAGLLNAATVATISISVSSGPTRQIRAARTTSS